jgi:hypothetical protein
MVVWAWLKWFRIGSNGGPCHYGKWTFGFREKRQISGQATIILWEMFVPCTIIYSVVSHGSIVQLWSRCNRPLNGCVLVSLIAFLKCISYAKRNNGIVSIMNCKGCRNITLWFIIWHCLCIFLKSRNIACVQQTSEPWASQVRRKGVYHYIEFSTWGLLFSLLSAWCEGMGHLLHSTQAK